jgi:hypothetical protein
MADLAQIELALWHLSTVLTAVLLVRVVAIGLAREYPAATFYLATTLARSVTLQTVTWFSPGYDPFRSPLYPQVYLYTLPLLWASYFAVVYEIYSKVLEGYKGLSVLSRRTLTAAVVLSFLVSAVSVWPDFNYDGEIWGQLRTTLLVERAVLFSLLFFLVLNALFLTWYPIPLRRNLLVYSFVFAALFFTVAGVYFYRNLLGHEWTRILSAAMTGANCLCLLVWMLLWRRQGEEVVSLSLAVRDPGAQRKLLDQLQQLNAILERKPVG